MSAPRLDRHPDNVRSRQSTPQQAPLQQDPENQEDHRQDEYNKPQRLYTTMSHFCDWDHGYLKIKRDSNGRDLHLTWTWTLTAAAGSYVYVRCNFWELDFGLDVLSRKVLEVDEQSRKPTPDKRNPLHNSR